MSGPAIRWLDEASRTRVRIASSGSAEALVFHQPKDGGFGWFMKSDDTLGFGTWAMRMQFGNGWRPGDSFSAYEATIFHEDLSTVPNAYPCPTGDPVADGCPGATGDHPVSTTCTDGFCHCIQCFSGIACSTPECSTPNAPEPDLVPRGSGIWVTSTKNRFLSFSDAFGVCEPLKAARVTFVSLPRPYDLWNGHQLWVTNPVEVGEHGGPVRRAGRRLSLPRRSGAPDPRSQVTDACAWCMSFTRESCRAGCMR